MTGKKTKYVGFWMEMKIHNILKKLTYEFNADAQPDIPMTPSGMAQIILDQAIPDYNSKDLLDRIKF